MAKKKLNNQTDGRRAYSAAVDSMYSNSPSGSTRSRTAAKRVDKEYDDKYEAELRKLRKKYATPYRGNEVTGFGKTAPRKSGSGGASQKGGMYRKQTRPDFEYFQKEPAKQRQENTARRLNPKKK